ncbi:hypothetical protein HanHA300_Chr10g0377061 [Helianthus annuus]|nr:hypothetical protein HanHA300_Chr10g0377061 [Helianthus annuus]KAJ0523499.1 hypothetical protein HanIR_Chr10g0494511 [Helianthus annuus]KAJ0531295.1 hypothetical protein HanHA89_Chr10g0399551 [Helianthus annuus]KAJ0698131.1 hypothetical protein HanLR1_Chr10g0376741 [Helianthus annuus]
MASKNNLSGCFNTLTKNGLDWYIERYAIPASLHPVLPEKNKPIFPFPPGKIGVYTRLFDYCNYRLPLTKFLIGVLTFHEVHITQMNPFGLAKVCHFELACRGLGSEPDLDVFRAFYKLNRSGNWYTFEVRDKDSCCYTWITTSIKDWKERFFYVDDRCVPEFMVWRTKKMKLPSSLPKDFDFNRTLYATLIKEAGRIQSYPEHILVMGRISTIWSELAWYPTLRWDGEVMGLKEALRLKSFDSKELEIRATRTPKSDPPYLTVVNENLYQIREPEALDDRGGLNVEGGAGPSLTVPTGHVAAAQIVTATGSGEGKGKGGVSIGSKGSGSKFIIEDEGIHLSVGDEGERAENLEGDGGDEEDENEGEGPHITLKRKRASSKSGPKLKQKKTKLDLKTITLDDDDDQVTGFSAAGGVLENLDAHLHEGRTPRDHPKNIRSSPLSFGGKGVKVVTDVRTSDPKRIEPSPSGLGGIEDMDSAKALEKYVPEWSLTNKDRIVDALSAKMALFHFGTPAEHSHHQKMSGPELGNALMVNQAQSNSLVVEVYRRWIESESNCNKLRREVANLEKEDNIRSKTKQELNSLRVQVDRLKEQNLEAKEVNKSSQASAAAAYEARDKALQDLETFKSKVADLEKKLTGVEMKHAAELKEMQASHDQLLADYHRLSDAKDEIERARDREIESHKTTIDEARGMLIRCERDMIEAYAELSELKLTKQWFLTDGVAWVVKLVHQSPELEKVVADLVNIVNAVGANEGIKQGFKAAQDLVGSAEEVPGYDAGAQSALEDAVKAFDELNISVLDKVADLINEPLSVIQQRSKLPIVGDDDSIARV